jgi:hypothetical protein
MLTRPSIHRSQLTHAGQEKREQSVLSTVTNHQTPRQNALHSATPLLFDVVVPVGLYYLLSAVGIADTPALILGGLVPFARSVRSLLRRGEADYLAVMMVGLFVIGLILVAFTGSPKFVLVKESFGTALIGLWCLGSAWTARPLTFYTARPFLTKGRPDALRSWDHLAETSAPFQSIQHRLAIFWGSGLLVEAGVRVGIVAHYSVHTAAGLVNVAAVVIIVALCLLTGPFGGLRLQRLLAADMAAQDSKEALHHRGVTLPKTDTEKGQNE